MTLHYAPTTPEEEELALALALSASLSSAATRLPSSAISSSQRPAHPPSSCSASSSSSAPRPARPTPAPSLHLDNNTHAHTSGFSSHSHPRQTASVSPCRSRWQTGSASAPAASSPKAASASTSSLASASALGRSLEHQPCRATSPLRPARPSPPYPHLHPPPPPQPAPQPHLPPLAPPAVVARSKSATGPGALLGAAAGCGGASGSGSGSGRSAVAVPPPALVPVRPTPSPAAPQQLQQRQQQQHRSQHQQQQPQQQLFSDPEACAGCGRGFGVFARTWVVGMGRKWHPECFKCGFCHEPISDGRGSFSYQLHPSDPAPYHPDCYRHVHHPLCTVCGSFVPASAEGVISYKENGFWRERYCPSHSETELRRCCACSRLQKQGEEWAPLPDDRPLCLQCVSSVILDTREAQPLYDSVLAFFRGEMKLPHAYKPPLLLVDGPTLNAHAQAEGRDDSGGAPVFHVRGLCVATMYSHIPSILRDLSGTLRSVSTATSQLSPASSSTSASSVHCHVKVLLLLYGLPRLLSGSIMAHELMHAWLRMEGVVDLASRVEEGLCQLMACLWLDRQHELLKGNPEEQRLASFFSYQIRTDTSEVYGDGFRDAMEAFQTYGLTAMIRNVKQYGRLTPP